MPINLSGGEREKRQLNKLSFSVFGESNISRLVRLLADNSENSRLIELLKTLASNESEDDQWNA